MYDDFFGRKLFHSSRFRWEELAKEYIPHFMWYHDEPDGSRVGWCSYCSSYHKWEPGEEDIYSTYGTMLKMRHGERECCPSCDIPLTFINENKMTSYNSLSRVHRLIFSDEISRNEVHFYAVRVINHPDEYEAEQFIEFEPSAVYELSPGNVKMYKYQGNDEWKLCKSYYEPFQTYYGRGGDYDFVELGHEFEFGETFLQYSQFDDFENVGKCACKGYGDRYYYYMTYLCDYCLHPQLEFLMKCGGYSWVYDLVYNRDLNKRYIDWSAKSYVGMFRMNKQEMKAFKSCCLNSSLLKLWYEQNKAVSMMEMFYVFKGYSSGLYSSLIALLKAYGISVERLNGYFDNYLSEKRDLLKFKYDDIFCVWRDYVEACEKLKIDLSTNKMLFPKDLITAHDERVMEVDLLENQALVMRAQRSLERRDRQYRFEDERFIIYVPKLPFEFVRESEMQDNCVAKSYMSKHFNDETTIVFLREKSCVEESFYTIEIRGRTVWQKHGFHNDNNYYHATEAQLEKWNYYQSRPLAEADAFYEKWLKWVESGSPRDTKGNPVIKKKEIRKRA